jgi:hypothetical protein
MGESLFFDCRFANAFATDSSTPRQRERGPGRPCRRCAHDRSWRTRADLHALRRNRRREPTAPVLTLPPFDPPSCIARESQLSAERPCVHKRGETLGGSDGVPVRWLRAHDRHQLVGARVERRCGGRIDGRPARRAPRDGALMRGRVETSTRREFHPALRSPRRRPVTFRRARHRPLPVPRSDWAVTYAEGSERVGAGLHPVSFAVRSAEDRSANTGSCGPSAPGKVIVRGCTPTRGGSRQPGLRPAARDHPRSKSVRVLGHFSGLGTGQWSSSTAFWRTGTR